MIIHSLIASLICVCLFRAFEEGGIFYKIRLIIHSLTCTRYTAFIRNPIYDCLTCMCSLWGILYILFNHYLLVWQFTVWESLLFILTTGGLNTLWEALILIGRGITKIAETVQYEHE